MAYFLSSYMEKLMLIGNICSIVEYVFASSYSTAIFHQSDQQQECMGL